MQYTAQVEGSPYQIQPGEAFSAYVARMDDATGGSFLADYAEERPDVVDLLGTVESAPLADALWSEMTAEQRTSWTEDSPDYETITQGLSGDLDYPEDEGEEALDAYHRVVTERALDDCLSRADLLGLAEMCAPGVLARVAARLRSA